MIELKVHCDCGQKYKFDVEPVNQQMPFTVACPLCHRDGTAKANALLQQMTVFKPIESAPPSASAMPPPPPPPAPARVRMTVAAPAPAGAVPVPPPIAPVANATPTTPPPIAPVGAAAPPPIGARVRPGAAPAVAPGKEPSFGLGLLGGFLGAVVGSLIYFAIFKTTGVRIFLAIGVGALAGASANFLGRGEGSKELGGLVAVFVVCGCLAAQYFVLLGIWNDLVSRQLDGGYADQVATAKEAVKAVPTGSDDEIRVYLARQAADEGEVAKPAAVPAEEVQRFRDKDLPRYRELAGGKVTKEQYLAETGHDSAKLKKFENEQGEDFKAVFIGSVLSLRAIISLVLGVGVAYRFSTNARGG